MTPSQAQSIEQAVFDSIIPELEAQGFAVFTYPGRQLLPPLLAEAQPDLVALKDGRKVAIEVLTSGQPAEAKAQRLRAAFANQPDWELRLIYAPPLNPAISIPVATPEMIEDQLYRIEHAYDAMGSMAALLIGWSAFEAAARRALPASLDKPQTTSRLLELLAFEGYLMPEEADRLRELSRIRNAVAHGRLDIEVERQGISDLAALTRALLRFGQPVTEPTSS